LVFAVKFAANNTFNIFCCIYGEAPKRVLGWQDAVKIIRLHAEGVEIVSRHASGCRRQSTASFACVN